MSEGLNIKTSHEDDNLVVTFSGLIDEDSSFESIENKLNGNVIFDFEEVSLINSCGIREWVTFLESVDKGTILTYRNCRQIIIEQVNMVHGFIRDGARIESFYAPYYCEECDQEHKVHLNVADVKDGKAPEIKCPKCKTADLEFDAIEEQYFQFIK